MPATPQPRRLTCSPDCSVASCIRWQSLLETPSAPASSASPHELKQVNIWICHCRAVTVRSNHFHSSQYFSEKHEMICSKPSFLPAPCPPTNLTARADCGTNLGTLNWMPSIHAISYTATLTGTHGHVVSCSSNTTSCSVKLDCGHQYSAVVIASSATCNSSTGASLTFDSGN